MRTLSRTKPVVKIIPRVEERNTKDYRTNRKSDVWQVGEESSVRMTPFSARVWRFMAIYCGDKGIIDCEWHFCRLLGMVRKTFRARLECDHLWALEDLRKVQSELQSTEFVQMVVNYLECK